MRVDLNRRKLLFKIRTQQTNSSNGYGRDERHNTEVDGRMYREMPKLLIWLENTYKQKKNQNGRGMIGAVSRKKNG